MQLVLTRDDGKSKQLTTLPVGELSISEFNPRKTRSAADIEKLAQRIERNGFEVTRALWVYKNGAGYKVFAGGNRLEALKRTSLDEAPVLVYDGFTEDEITRLADEDNENDEYHAPVPIVDVWMDYKALDALKWTQQRIADAKGVKQSHVALRLKLSSLPHKVIESFIKNDFLKESHGAEILGLSNFDNLSAWRTFESVAIQVIDTVLDRVRVKGPTAKQFKDEVDRQNEITQMAQDIYESLGEEWRAPFVAELTASAAGTKAQIQTAHNTIIKKQLKAAEERQRAAREEQSKAEQAQQQAEAQAKVMAAREAILAKVVFGDSQQTVEAMPLGVTLMLTDPPYGKEFESNRRVGVAKAGKLANDDASIFDITKNVLAKALPRMADDATVILFTDWKNEQTFRVILEEAGLYIRGSYIWLKPNHGIGDLDGTFAPKHERFLHAVKGNPKLTKRPPDVLEGEEFLGTEHPTEKPLDLLRTIIDACTMPGDCVADPFCGSGSVGVAAYQTDRDFWLCDVSEKWHGVATEVIFNAVL